MVFVRLTPQGSGLLASRSEPLKVFGNFVEGVGDFSNRGACLEKPASPLNFEGIEGQGSIDLVAVFGEVQAVIIGKPGSDGIEVVADHPDRRRAMTGPRYAPDSVDVSSV